MPIRFQRRFKILPGVRINVSKGGISTTVGIRGLHLTFNKHGIRRTIGLPGSGLSETSYIKKYDDNDDNDNRDRRRASGDGNERRLDAGEDRERSRDADSDRDRDRDRRDDDDDGPEIGCFPWGCLGFILIVLVLGFWIGTAMDLIPPNYLSQVMLNFTQAIREAGY